MWTWWFVAAVAAPTVRVCPTPDPGCDETSIARALATGFHVVLAPGFYTEQGLELRVSGQQLRSEDPARPAIFALPPSPMPGPVLRVVADDAVVADLVFDGANYLYTPYTRYRALEVVGGGGVRLERLEVRNFRGHVSGSSLYVQDAQVTVEDSRIRDGLAEGSGGLVEVLRVEGPTALTIRRSTLEGGTALDQGGAIVAYSADVLLQDTTVKVNAAGVAGGQIAAYAGSLVLQDVRLELGAAPVATAIVTDRANVRMHRVGIVTSPGGTGVVTIRDADLVDLDQVTASDLEGAGHAFEIASSNQVSIHDSVLAGVEELSGGGLKVSDLQSLEVVDNWFCGFTSSQGAGMIVRGACDACVIDGNHFVDNSAPEAPSPGFADGVAMDATLTAGRVVVRQNTFASNTNAFEGSVLTVVADDVIVERNLFVDNELMAPIANLPPMAVVAANAALQGTELVLGDADPQLLPLRPQFVTATAGRWQPTACEEAWMLNPGHPNNAALFDGGIGAGSTDDDGDGYFGIEDCDDDAATVSPRAVEVPGDGIDQDCDGFEVCYADEDGDGFGRTRVTGLDWFCVDAVTIDGDCVDTNPRVYPTAIEIPDDGIDQDCDGFDASGPPEPPAQSFFAGVPRGCTTAPSAWWLGGLVALVATRRGRGAIRRRGRRGDRG